jgi:transcriptional regulator with XRE-family HTH domain
MPSKLSDFCKRLRAELTSQGVSEYRLAKRAGISSQAVAKLTSGSVPSIETARAVADALGLSLDWLAGRIGAEKYFENSEKISPTKVD